MDADTARIVQAFNNRLGIYRHKRAMADVYADCTYSRHDALNYVVEAIELLARECGIEDAVPHAKQDA